MDILVSGLQMLQYGIPKNSCHGYKINQDAAYVDHRCFSRYERKFKAEYRKYLRSPEYTAKLLEDARIMRQWEREAAARRLLERIGFDLRL